MAEIFLLAAKDGNVQLLKTELEQNYSRAIELLRGAKDENDNNVIHVAAKEGRDEFIREAVEWLHKAKDNDLLLFAKNKQGRNPLHLAAGRGNLEIVEILAASYYSADAPAPAPATQAGEGVIAINIPHQAWIEKDSNGMTPFLMAIENGHEEVALYMLDHFPSICDATDNDGYRLYIAVQNGLTEVALRLLESTHSKQQLTFGDKNPLSVVPYCSEQVFKKLLRECPELAEKCNERGENFLHQWADGDCDQMQEAFKWLLQLQDTEWSEVSKRYAIIRHLNNFDENPLHIAARLGKFEAAKLLRSAYFKNQAQDPNQQPPWLQQNIYGDTPLLAALRYKKEDTALCLLEFDKNSQCAIASYNEESPLFLAVKNGCLEAAKSILNELQQYNVQDATSYAAGPYGQNPMHVASNCRGIEICMTKFCREWARSEDRKGYIPLDYAAEAGDTTLIATLIQCSAVDRDNRAWIKACKGGHIQALYELISRPFRPNGFTELHERQSDTPLHHITLARKEDYEEFISRPEIKILKDSKDKDGATPLHRAIEQWNMELVEVLLSKDVDLTMKDRRGRKASYLLKIRCNESKEWKEMCKRLRVYSRLGTSYIHPETDLEQLRGAMAIVAALLATITFAAGIQIPGGLDEKTGYALNAKKLAFMVFLISDTIAMCLSLLVLIFLIWTLTFSVSESVPILDHSVRMLQASLVGTLLAFMTGVYVAVSHESFWLAIVVIVICSAVPITALRDNLRNLYTSFSR